MLKSKLVLLTIVSLSTLSVFAQELPTAHPKVIYGVDDRRDIKDVMNSLYLRLAESTAAMIPRAKMLPNGMDYTLNCGTLQTDAFVCAEERFSQQLVGALCSGFLVGPDTLVTAGHCAESIDDCNSNYWVFDYHDHIVNKNNPRIAAKNVYRCKSIVSQDLDPLTMRDYAVIKLDRVAYDRTPLKYRTSGKVADNTSLVIIGHPTGLPTKVADGANVRDNLNPVYFSANLDSFGGNSGSAVFDAKTGQIEGILVRGDEDYHINEARMCKQVTYRDSNGGMGEQITRITMVYGLPGVNAAPPTSTEGSQVLMGVPEVLGRWRNSVNANLTLELKSSSGSILSIARGFSAAKAEYTSEVVIDHEGVLELDFIPGSFCKMYLRPVSSNKMEFAYCAKRFNTSAYFTR